MGSGYVSRAFEQGLQGRLLLVGDGPLAAACDRLVADSRWRSRIVRKGAVAWEEGRRLRREADIATQHNQEDPATGQVEAFGVAIAEAMAEGLPVVGTRSGGVVEIVADGVTVAMSDQTTLVARQGGEMAIQAVLFTAELTPPVVTSQASGRSQRVSSRASAMFSRELA